MFTYLCILFIFYWVAVALRTFIYNNLFIIFWSRGAGPLFQLFSWLGIFFIEPRTGTLWFVLFITTAAVISILLLTNTTRIQKTTNNTVNGITCRQHASMATLQINRESPKFRPNLAVSRTELDRVATRIHERLLIESVHSSFKTRETLGSVVLHLTMIVHSSLAKS